MLESSLSDLLEYVRLLFKLSIDKQNIIND